MVGNVLTASGFRGAGYARATTSAVTEALLAFCDEVVLINKTVLAYGDTSEVFTEENLARTFGGSPAQRLTSPSLAPRPEPGREPWGSER